MEHMLTIISNGTLSGKLVCCLKLIFWIQEVNPTKTGGGGGATSTPTFFEDAYLTNA